MLMMLVGGRMPSSPPLLAGAEETGGGLEDAGREDAGTALGFSVVGTPALGVAEAAGRDCDVVGATGVVAFCSVSHVPRTHCFMSSLSV